MMTGTVWGSGLSASPCCVGLAVILPMLKMTLLIRWGSSGYTIFLQLGSNTIVTARATCFQVQQLSEMAAGMSPSTTVCPNEK